MEDSQKLEINAQFELLGSRDAQEAAESYIAKRTPHFTGE
jgi:hypothetical protein